MSTRATRRQLESLYVRYNRREFVHPDPLEFLYGYQDPADREIVALVAGALAYGRVAQILRSVSTVLDRMAPSPAEFLLGSSRRVLTDTFADFKHRFTTGEDLAALLHGARLAIERHGSLGECLRSGLGDDDETILPAMSAFVDTLAVEKAPGRFSLLPPPSKGSACKRLNLMFRWMVRRDDVDPGGWEGIPTSHLIVPVDTHMYKVGRALRLTRRKQANLRAALDITAGFRAITPDDPVRYDFALTRPGIREGKDTPARQTRSWLFEVA